MAVIKKIVITGGPCAGKSTAMSWIQNAFQRLGYRVLFVPETATELITGGVCPWTCGTNEEYQKCQVKLQIAKEQIFAQAASTMTDEKILIVCDRGIMDNKVYMTDAEFERVLEYVGLTEIEARDSYDAVFHLVTAAKGAEEFYSNENNAARYENEEQACRVDDNLIRAWSGHPHLRVIDNSTDFDEKMKRLLSEVSAFLQEDGLLEVRRTFLIEYPDLDWLENRPETRKISAVRTYIRSGEGERVSVRQREDNGSYLMFETSVRFAATGERADAERRLSEEEYLRLLASSSTDMAPVHKTKYYFIYKSQYFTLDLYPQKPDLALIEIGLTNADREIVFPPEVKVIREVTGEEEFSDHYISYKLAGSL